MHTAESGGAVAGADSPITASAPEETSEDMRHAANKPLGLSIKRLIAAAAPMVVTGAGTKLRLVPAHERGAPRLDDGGHRRLWVVHQYAVSPDMPETVRQWELASLLKDFGWTTTIFATAFNHKMRTFVRPVSPVRPVVTRDEQGVRFVWLYSAPYNGNDWRRYVNMFSFFCLATGVGLWRRSPSIVIGTSPNLFAGLAGWIIAKRHRVPFVLEVQDLWPESLVQLGLNNRLIIAVLAGVETFLYKRADRVICLTDGIRDGVLSKHVDAGKVELISNAAMRPPPLGDSNRDELRRQLGWDERVVAIWLGAHGQANGLNTIVEAARVLQGCPSVLIVLLGDGPEKKGLIEQARGLPNVRFLDPVPKTEVGDYLRAADIGILNSKKFKAFEGARPNKLFDYMSAGLPIVVSMPGEATRMVREASCGVEAEWENPRSIADGIRRLASDPELRSRLGASGFSYLSTYHTRESTARQLDKLLKSAVEGRKSRYPRNLTSISRESARRAREQDDAPNQDARIGVGGSE